jgi:hypothetical protein
MHLDTRKEHATLAKRQEQSSATETSGSHAVCSKDIYVANRKSSYRARLFRNQRCRSPSVLGQRVKTVQEG